MKKNIQFLPSKVTGLTFFSTLLLLILTFAFPSCKNADTKDSKEIAEEHNEAKFEEEKEEDADFLVGAAELYLEEIQLGKLAQTKSTNKDVIELAKTMENNHSKALTILQELAAKKQITIPTTLTENGQDASKDLMDKSGIDFDKEYCDKMVNGHKDAIDKFEKISTDAVDLDIRFWAASVIPELRMHLDKSLTCQEKVGNLK